MPDPEPDFLQILEVLSVARVQSIVVGGVCAVLHGAPISTFDLDLVYLRDPDNLRRLAAVLESLGSYYREEPEIIPDAERLDTPGHHLLMTRFGPLGLLGSVVGDRDYNDLLDHTEMLEIAEDLLLRVLDLPTLVTIKRELGRDRDRAVLPILERTLAERELNG